INHAALSPAPSGRPPMRSFTLTGARPTLRHVEEAASQVMGGGLSLLPAFRTQFRKLFCRPLRWIRRRRADVVDVDLNSLAAVGAPCLPGHDALPDTNRSHRGDS